LTSTKRDVIDATAQARSEVGSTLLFDPLGDGGDADGVISVGWSPLLSAAKWDGALATSSAMVAASQRRAQGSRGVDHWSERSAALLSTLLHAGALSGLQMSSVLRWVDRHEGGAALEVLDSLAGNLHPSTALLSGILATDSREQSAIWSTTSGVLGAYRSIGALETTERPVLDAKRFVEGSHTLYVCATGRSQELAAPLVVGLLGEIRDAAYRHSSIDRPVLFALDELANIAPLPDLPQLVSEGGGQGVLTIGCLQDLSQARTRWGPEADGFLSLFSTTMLFGGVADRSTLRSFHELAGSTQVPRKTVTGPASRWQRRGSTESWSFVDEHDLKLDEAARMRPGEVLLLDAHNQVGRVGLTVAHRDEPWRSLTGGRERIALSRSR
jgi:type IV secretory pathway TraG/TraD family ATPase VirD4